jgi:hypothetical protein
MHIHWHRKAGRVRGPFAMFRGQGALGHRRYRCRCGREEVRDEWASRADYAAYMPTPIRPTPPRSS